MTTKAGSGTGQVALTMLSAVPWIFLIGLCLSVFAFVSVELMGFLPAAAKADRRVWTEVGSTLSLTLFYAITSATLQVFLGLVAALVVQWSSRGWIKALFITVMLAPYATPPALIGMVYRYVFGPNAELPQFFANTLNVPATTWYVDHPVAAATAASVWQFFPFAFLLIYVALLGTPGAQLRAARLDGAPFWTLTIQVVLRRIAPVLLAVLTLRLIFMLVKFDTPYIFTEAGLASTADVATVEIYQAFRGSPSFTAPGESLAALAIFVLAATGAVVYSLLTLRRATRGREGAGI